MTIFKKHTQIETDRSRLPIAQHVYGTTCTDKIINKHQSNMAKSRIAMASPPNGLFVFASLQLKFDSLTTICNCTSWL